MKAFPVFDAHCDTALELWERQASLRQNSGQWDLARRRSCRGGRSFLPFAPFARPLRRSWGPRRCWRGPMPVFAAAGGVPIAGVRDAAEVERQLPTGAVLLSLEGAEGIGCDRAAWSLCGCRALPMTGLTWNYENSLAGSHMTGQGLSAGARIMSAPRSSWGCLWM